MALSGLADQPACGSRAPEARASLAGALPSPRAGVGPHSAAAQSFADSALVQACEFCVRLAGTTAFPFRCAPRARRRGDAPHELGHSRASPATFCASCGATKLGRGKGKTVRCRTSSRSRSWRQSILTGARVTVIVLPSQQCCGTGRPAASSEPGAQQNVGVGLQERRAWAGGMIEFGLPAAPSATALGVEEVCPDCAALPRRSNCSTCAPSD